MPGCSDTTDATQAYTVAETASKLACSTEKVRKLIHAGELEAFRHGPREYRITHAAITAYQSANRVR